MQLADYLALAKRLRRMIPHQPPMTHAIGCWRYHDGCAIALAADTIEMTTRHAFAIAQGKPVGEIDLGDYFHLDAEARRILNEGGLEGA